MAYKIKIDSLYQKLNLSNYIQVELYHNISSKQKSTFFQYQEKQLSWAMVPWSSVKQMLLF